MASYKPFVWALTFFFTNRIYGKEYILGKLNQCTRVPEEPPCNITFDYFVPDYASKRYRIMMETIYRKSRDIMRLDSRPKCVDAYKSFLCAQLFPRCSKHQNPRFQNLKMQRWVLHDPGIKLKCLKIFGSCNSRVAARFMSADYFLCDHLTYTPLGWESDRCVHYDLDTRCPNQYGKLPLWYLNYHDQNLIQFLNVTTHRLNHTLPKSCRRKLLNMHCRHPECSADGQHLVMVNYTRQQCDRDLKCARFVPGEVNVDAMCIMFPSFAPTLLSSPRLVATILVLYELVFI